MKHAMSWQDNQINTKLGFVIGALTGLTKMVLNVHLPIDFISKLFESALTAGICGFIGVAGKELFVVAKRAFTAYFKKRKSKK
jgi:hypothetical protein